MTHLKYAVFAVSIATLGAFVDVKFSVLLLSMYVIHLSMVLDKESKAREVSDNIIRTYESHFIKQLWRYNRDVKTANHKSLSESNGQTAKAS